MRRLKPTTNTLNLLPIILYRGLWLIIVGLLLAPIAKGQFMLLGDTTYLKAAIRNPKASDKVWTDYLRVSYVAREVAIPNYINFVTEGLEAAKQHNNFKHYNRLLGLRAAIYHSSGDDNSAKEVLKQIKEYVMLHKDDTTMVYYLITHARVVARTENYTEGARIALDALVMAKRLGLKRLEVRIAALYAHLYGFGGSYAKTLNLYQDALKLAKLRNDTLGIAFINNNMAIIYSNAEKFDSAIACLKVCFTIAERYKMQELAYLAKATTSGIYFEQGNYEECLRIATQVATRRENIGLPLVDIWLLQIKASKNLGRYKEVEALCYKAIEAFRAQNRRIEANQVWGWLAESLLKTGKIKEASAALDSFFLLSNIYHNDKQVMLINELELKYQDKQKALTIANLKANNQSQSKVNYLLIAVLVLAAGLILIGGYLGINLNKRRKDVQAKNQIIKAQNVQLASLNNSKDRIMGIIAHDLRGPLGTLGQVSDFGQQLIEAEEYTSLKDVFVHLRSTTNNINDLLGNLLDWAVSQEGNLSVQPTELKVADVWAKVEGLYEDLATAKTIGIATRFADGAIVYADYNSIYTILRNLLNNALKFSSSGGSIIVTALQEEGGMTVISIMDNGKGMTASQLDRLRVADRAQHTRGTAGEQGVGLGMLIVKELLALNKGRIMISSGINLGTTIKLYLPTINSGMASINPTTEGVIITKYLELTVVP